LLLLLLTSGLALPQRAVAETVQVAVAANFLGTMQLLVKEFERSSGHRARLSAGSTGKFYSQISAGAPFDVLLAADHATPTRLIAEGHAVAGSSFTYAIGQLVLWSAQADLIDGRAAVLSGSRFRYLAVADPKTAPYGAAAIQVLHALGLLPALQPRLVVGESVGQAYQFVVTGNAELGFVAWSQVLAAGQRGSFWRVPPELHKPLLQNAVLLKAGAHNPAAAALMSFLTTPAARKLIQAHGYSL